MIHVVRILSLCHLWLMQPIFLLCHGGPFGQFSTQPGGQSTGTDQSDSGHCVSQNTLTVSPRPSEAFSSLTLTLSLLHVRSFSLSRRIVCGILASSCASAIEPSENTRACPFHCGAGPLFCFGYARLFCL